MRQYGRNSMLNRLPVSNTDRTKYEHLDEDIPLIKEDL